MKKTVVKGAFMHFLREFRDFFTVGAAIVIPIALCCGILYASIYFAVKHAINDSLLGKKLRRDLEGQGPHPGP